MQTYRLNAEKCLVLARTFNDRERRLALLDMANAWLTLAEQHLWNRKTVLVYVTPTPCNRRTRRRPSAWTLQARTRLRRCL